MDGADLGNGAQRLTELAYAHSGLKPEVGRIFTEVYGNMLSDFIAFSK
jgi:hypothetical protein